MRSFKNLSLTAALISISVSAYAADPCAGGCAGWLFVMIICG